MKRLVVGLFLLLGGACYANEAGVRQVVTFVTLCGIASVPVVVKNPDIGKIPYSGKQKKQKVMKKEKAYKNMHVKMHRTHNKDTQHYQRR